MVGTSTAAPSIGVAGVKVLPIITGFGPILSREIGQRATVIGAAFGTALAAPLGLAASAAIRFEDAFAAIRKTVDLSDAGFEELEGSIRKMATEIPIAVEELSRFGAIAGQLGITGVADLENFIETIARLSVAVDGISAEDAAISLARFINVTGRNFDKVDELGAGLVALGNQFNATEGEILHFSQLLAGAGTVIGLTQENILGIATSLASAGIAPERAGSAFSRLFLTLGAAADAGGEKMETFAAVAGTSVEDFASRIKGAPAEAIRDFLEGFRRIAEESPAAAIDVLDTLSLNTERVRDVMFRSSAALRDYDDAQKVANESVAEGSALIIESERRFETTSSQIQLLKNTFNELGITIGEKLLPVFKGLLSFTTGVLDIIRSIPTPILVATAAFFAITGAAIAGGSAFLYAGQHLAKLFALFRLSRTMGGFIPLFRGLARGILDAGNSAAAASTQFTGLGASLAQRSNMFRTAAGNISTVGTSTQTMVKQFRSSHGVIAKTGAAFKTMGSAVGKFIGGGGWFLLLAAGAFLVTARFKSLEKTAISTSDAADELATSLGLVNDSLKLLKTTSEGDIEIDVTLSDTAANTIAELRGMPEEFRKQFLIRIAADLFFRGNTPEQAINAVKQLAEEAGIEIPIGIEAESLEEFSSLLVEQATSAAQHVADLLSTGAFALGDSVSVGIAGFLNSDFKQGAEEISNIADEILRLERAGQDNDAVEFWQAFEEGIRSSGISAHRQDAILAKLANTVLLTSGTIDSASINIRDMDSSFTELLNNDAPQFFNELRYENGRLIASAEKGVQVLDAEGNVIGEVGEASVTAAEQLALLEAAEEDAAAAAIEAAEALEAQRQTLINGIPLFGEWGEAQRLNVNDATTAWHDYVTDMNNIAVLLQDLDEHSSLSDETIQALREAPVEFQRSLVLLAQEDPFDFSRALGHFEEMVANLAGVAAGGIEEVEGTLADLNLQGVFDSHPLLEIFDWEEVKENEVAEARNAARVIEQEFYATGVLSPQFANRVIGGLTGAASDGAAAFQGQVETDIREGLRGSAVDPRLINSAKFIGKNLATGIISGFRSINLEIELTKHISKGLDEVGSNFGIDSPSTYTIEKIGLPLGQGIPAGVRMAIPDAVKAFGEMIDVFGEDVGPTTTGTVGYARGMSAAGTAASAVPVSGGTSNRVYNLTINNPTTRDLARDSERFLGVIRTTELMDL